MREPRPSNRRTCEPESEDEATESEALGLRIHVASGLPTPVSRQGITAWSAGGISPAAATANGAGAATLSTTTTADQQPGMGEDVEGRSDPGNENLLSK